MNKETSVAPREGEQEDSSTQLSQRGNEDAGRAVLIKPNRNLVFTLSKIESH